MTEIVQEIKSQIAREYEKALYILDLLDCEENEIPLKIKENDFGLNASDFEALLMIESHKHKAFDSNKIKVLLKLQG